MINANAAFPISGVRPDVALQVNSLESVAYMIDINSPQVEVQPSRARALLLVFFSPHEPRQFLPVWLVIGDFAAY